MKKTRQSTKLSNSLKREVKEFPLRDLRNATSNFSEKNKVGEGGSSTVYKGCLPDGSVVAIKRLVTGNIDKDETEYIYNDISMPSHPNLLPLLGFCITTEEKLLVFPLMVNGSLKSCLRISNPQLDWQKRKRVAHRTAVALAHLHNCSPKIIHRDVNSDNILLDENFEAFFGGFRLVKFLDAGRTHASMVSGTFGYHAPEYLQYGICSEKTDVHGYGILLLEIITGCNLLDNSLGSEAARRVTIPDWIGEEMKINGFQSIVDSNLRGKYVFEELKELVDMALRCTQELPERRPKMFEVVQKLEDVFQFSKEGMKEDVEEDAEEDAEEGAEEGTEEGTEGDIEEDIDEDWITDFLDQPSNSTHLNHPNTVFSAARSMEPLNSLSNQGKEFPLNELIKATNNFQSKQLGVGRHGVVYEGCLADGTKVAVKKLFSDSTEVETEFDKTKSMPVHPNLLRLLGFCKSDDPKERLLVFPLMVNGDLRSCLKPHLESKPPLDWKTRKQIAYGTAVGLAYLHNECKAQIIHRDIKPENILLNETFEAVIADFGSVRRIDSTESEVVTKNVCGTAGFIAPEYWKNKSCSKKVDVYAYGVLLLQIITGDKLDNILPEIVKVSSISPFSYIKSIVTNMGVQRLVDSDLQGNYSSEDARKLINLALKCTRKSQEKRPEMYKVCAMLKRVLLQ